MRLCPATFVSSLAAVSAIFMGTPSSAAEPVEVTSCGQVLARSGYLSADLDCSGISSETPTVVIGPGGTLDLGGFHLTAHTSTGSVAAVECQRRCNIVGPGTITGSTGGSQVVGMSRWDGSRISVIGARIEGGAFGLVAKRVDALDATIVDNEQVGIWTFKAKVDNSVVSDNGTVGPYRHGVFGQVRSFVRNSTVTNNGQAGVRGWRVRIEDSTVDGNDGAAECATKLCGDVAAQYPPRIKNTTCTTSAREGEHNAYPCVGCDRPAAASTWGVCDSD